MYKRQVPGWIKDAQDTLSGEEPCIAAGDQCNSPFPCSFIGYCSPQTDPEDAFPPEVLPRNGNLAASLRAEGYTDLRDVPGERLSNLNHQRVWRISKTGKAELNSEASKIIAELPYPRYYIDFETINPAVPVWAGTRPYMPVSYTHLAK